MMNGNSVNIGLEFWLVCTMRYDVSLYSAGCKEKVNVDKAVFWSTVSEMNLQEPKFFCQKYPVLS